MKYCRTHYFLQAGQLAGFFSVCRILEISGKPGKKRPVSPVIERLWEFEKCFNRQNLTGCIVRQREKIKFAENY